MPYETDERLKGYLDTNQLHREQMCLAILALDRRFSEVRPRHPRGGPDGGRDIDAVFRGQQRAFGAIGFINQADDSAEKKRRIQMKFTDDLHTAADVVPKPDAFFFLTNMALTIGEREALVAEARECGFAHCEIFDRERLRIALDNSDGLSIRFQYLDISMSYAEQASFFARWGDDIQSLITTGFQRVQSTLDRLLFFHEATEPLVSLTILLELDRVYQAQEIGHFRAFCELFLKEPKRHIFSILFGSSDRQGRMHSDLSQGAPQTESGIRFGTSGGQWEQDLDVVDEVEGQAGNDARERYRQTGFSSSIGADEVKSIGLQYYKGGLIRFSPTLTVRDINDAMFVLLTNATLAAKVKSIHVHANEYKLLEVRSQDIHHEDFDAQPLVPVNFSDAELSDQWVRIHPTMASLFKFSFSEQTPLRMFSPSQTQNSSNEPPPNSAT